MDCSVNNNRYHEFENNLIVFEEFMIENICGYTLKQLELAVANSNCNGNKIQSLYRIRDYLINNYNNPTENNITTYINDFYLPHFNN